jgi:hypothetical protein
LPPTKEVLADFIREDLQGTINVAHLGGSVAALLMGLDPTVAGYTAANALYNNFAVSTVRKALAAYADKMAEVMEEKLKAGEDSGNDTDEGAEESGVGRARKVYTEPLSAATRPLTEALGGHAEALSRGEERYAQSKLHRLELMIGELPPEKQAALRTQYEEYYAEDRLALDLVQTAGSVAGALASLPGKAVDRFLRHTGLTDKYNARAAGHMVTDALGLAGAAAAAKGLAKSAVRGVRPTAPAAGPRKGVRFADAGAAKEKNWVREPSSIQDQMVLEAAKAGKGDILIDDLGDPRFAGMEKMELRVKSAEGKDSVVHYVRNPRTGELLDFKFKKRSTD